MSTLHIKTAGKHESGFTLIELSIVLVIIGLIVGGILTGQDLIKAAEQRATLAQIEKYNTAVNTFRNKFGGIPGDLPYGTANNFGLKPTAGSLTGGGDGNGALQDNVAAASDVASYGGENALFWDQISVAGLADGSWATGTAVTGLATSSGTTISASSTTDPMSNWLPVAKLGRGNYVYATAGADSVNYFLIGGIGTITVATGAVAAGTNNLNPLEAYSMDKKVDDGLATTGAVQATNIAGGALISTLVSVAATGLPTAPTNAVAGTAACTITGSTSSYNVSGNSGPTPGCTLRFKFN